MKRLQTILVLALLICSFTACLKRGLDPLPAYSDKKIDRFDFEYRWDDNGTFKVVRMSTTTTSVSEGVLDVKVVIPAASASFPQAVRDKVNLSNMVGMCNISTAASIEAIDGTPLLGVPGDYSKGNAKYKVTAADGSSMTWTATVHL